MKLLRLSLVCFIIQWFRLNGFLNPAFLKRDLSSKYQIERSLALQRKKVSFLPSFQLRMAKKKEPIDDFLDDSDDNSIRPTKQKIRAVKPPQKSPFPPLFDVVYNNEEVFDSDAYDDEFFPKWLDSEVQEDDDEHEVVEETKTRKPTKYDGETEKKPINDDLVRDDSGKIIGLSLRVNNLLTKLPLSLNHRSKIEKKLFNNPKFRAEFINIGERYLKWESRQFEKYLNYIYLNQNNYNEHYNNLQNDPDYSKNFQRQYEILDELRVKSYQQLEDMQRKLLPVFNLITEIRLNQTYADEFNKKLRENKNNFKENYLLALKDLKRYNTINTDYIKQFENLSNKIRQAEKDKTPEGQTFLKNLEFRLKNDPIFADVFDEGFKQLAKYQELEAFFNEIDINQFNPNDRTIVVPEGFIIQRYGAKKKKNDGEEDDDALDISDDEEENRLKPIILQLPETTKYATYSKLANDGRLLFTLQPYEDRKNPRKSDLSEVMVVFHKSVELQLIEPEITLEEDDEWPFDFNPLGIIKVPPDVSVIEVPASRMVGEISSVLIPKGMKVIRTRPDYIETPEGEVVLALPKEIEIQQKVGVYPKSQLIIEARRDKKYPVYHLSQNVTVRRLLPEDAAIYPDGVVIVPPLTAVSNKAHELLDYEFKERYLSTLPDDLRKEIGTAWQFEQRDNEQMKRVEKANANRRASSELDIDGTEDEAPFVQPDPQSADTWGDDIDWPRTFKQLDALKDLPSNYPAYCLLYFIRPDEINDLLQFEYDKHEQHARSYKRLIYHDIVRTQEFVNSRFKIPEFEGLFHFFVGKEDEWEETLSDVETFMASCPLKTGGKVERFKVIAIHEIDGERGRIPDRFKPWTVKEEVEIPEKEAIAQILKQYDADLPEEYKDL